MMVTLMKDTNPAFVCSRTRPRASFGFLQPGPGPRRNKRNHGSYEKQVVWMRNDSPGLCLLKDTAPGLVWISSTRPRPSFAQGYGPGFCLRRAYRRTTYPQWNSCSRIGIIASIVAVPIVFVIQIISRSILMRFTSGKEHSYTILMRRDSNQERHLHARYCSAIFRPLSTSSS
jgi:hypothetical protein